MPTFKEYIGNQVIPKGFWKKDNLLLVENIRTWVQWYESENNFASKDEWYNVTGSQINSAGGSGFFSAKATNQVHESVFQLMRFVYPDHPWKEWKFRQAPQGWWQVRENILRWMEEEVRPNEQIVDLDDFYKLKVEDLEKYRGTGWKARYGESLIFMLKDLYPAHTWYEWKFFQVPKQFWCEDGELQRPNIERWFDIELRQKGYATHEDMYRITQVIIKEAYGGGLVIHHFQGSPMNLLVYLYPEYNWQFWKFVSAPNCAWDSLENQKKYLNEEFIKGADCSVLYHCASRLPSGLMNKYITPFDLVSACFPEYAWDQAKFIGHEAQRRVFHCTKQVYPLAVSGYKESWCVNEESGRQLEFDEYIPEVNTIIETDGQQHFEQTWLMKTDIERDVYKMVCAHKQGIRIVRISQKDIANHDDDWLSSTLLPILADGSREHVYISEKETLYDTHKKVFQERVE